MDGKGPGRILQLANDLTLRILRMFEGFFFIFYLFIFFFYFIYLFIFFFFLDEALANSRFQEKFEIIH